MAKISLVKAFMQTADMISSGNEQKAAEAARIIIEGMEKSKRENDLSLKIFLSKQDKKVFSF